ncbi:hypothetical protein GRI89_02885 [Altererythrobacter salegens]|uniref:Virulence plasmid A protein n=1 Tax=Croceibacterium salegens TaxID=1737568 RepID=A0A6I4SRK7_9SPHN|nr:neuraminidase-like domain-containing protein [Croceibacterium salegens]MXO58493.1 hypothetical protein [Croceibacterium salegens]
MDKQQLLELEAKSHLTPAELREANDPIAGEITARLEESVAAAEVASVLSDSEPLHRLTDRVAVPLGDAPQRRRLRGAVFDAVRAAVAADPEIAADPEVETHLRKAEERAREAAQARGIDPTLAEAARLDEPVAFNPAFSAQLEAARIYRLGDAAGLADETAKVVIDNLGSLSEVSEERLAGLVRDGTLMATDAAAVGVAASVYAILDERPELVAAAANSLSNPAELVKHTAADWERLVTASGTTPPGELSAKDYGALLHEKIERLFLAEALSLRGAAVDAGKAIASNRALANIRKDNPDVPVAGAAELEALDTSRLTPTERKKAEEKHAEIRQFVNRFAGMGLDAVLDDANLTKVARKKEVNRRVELVNAFLAGNNGVLARDLTQGSTDLKEVRFPARASASDKAMVLAHVRTYQRALAVAERLDDAEALVSAGYRSAQAIASSDAQTVAAKARIDIADAEAYVARAKAITVRVTGHFGAIIDAVFSGKNQLPVDNTTPAITGFLKEIPGFADFFGNQDFCNCAHCQSILSPAAYFVDLMCFIDEHVTQPYFSTQPAHVLNLKTRRPDLWTIELTCDNTNKPIPYLTIINEILENAVATDSGFTGDLTNRAAVADHVYKTKLPDALDSFVQPLNLAFEEIRTFLRHFALTPANLGEAGLATGNSLTRLMLGVSPKDFALIATADDALAFLTKVYGVPLSETAGKIDRFEVSRLMKPMGITRADLDELVASRFVTEDGAVPIAFKGAKRTADSIQNDVEYIEGLTRAALDRLHRFARLRKVTGWKTGELDMVLAHLAQRGIGNGLDAEALGALARLQRLQIRLKLSIEELTPLWSAIPTMPILRKAPLAAGEGFPKAKSSQAKFTVSLFNRQFNQTRHVETGGSFPKDTAAFLHPALADSPSPNPDPELARLMAGTGTTEGELLELVTGLAPALGIEPHSATEADRAFALTSRNLTLLYRHARLAKLLRLPITELFALAGLVPSMTSGVVNGIDDLEDLCRAAAWLKGSRRKLSSLLLAVQPATPPALTSTAAVTATTAAQTVTYQATDGAGAAQNETVTFAAHGDLTAIVADWNGQAQFTRAYQSDFAGLPESTGTFLSIVGHAESGAEIQVTADAGKIFGTALPSKATARSTGATLAGTLLPTEQEIAATLAAQTRAASLLVFADSLFSFLPPFAARMRSRAALTNATGGEQVKLAVTSNGTQQATETITLAANATLDAIVSDWNIQSASTLAYRADVKGRPAVGGTRLGITARTGTGSTSMITVTLDSASIFAATVPVAFKGGEISLEASRAIVDANVARFEPVDGDGRYQLKANFDPAVALTVPTGIDSALEPALRGLLLAYHSPVILASLLPGLLGIDAAVLAPLVEMLGLDLAVPQIFDELRDPEMEHPILAGAIARLRRLDRALADASKLGAENLSFLKDKAAMVLGAASFDRLDLASLRRIDLFKQLSAPVPDHPERAADLRALLSAFTTANAFAAADPVVLAKFLDCAPGTAQSLQGSLPLAPIALDAFAELKTAADIVTLIGAPGELFTLAASTDYDDLSAASAAIRAGLRSKYQDQTEWEEKVEPYENTLLSRRRDGLVAYLIHTGTPQFDEISDLYYYYLLDVEVEGCMRTSRVAAAIDSAQLYVNRCLMNLEESPPGATPSVHIYPAAIPEDEWSWRKNYRVWEASRKIFLYPENYIEPELRDDKTPLFKALEEDLLSKDITDESVLEAFGRYLRGFDELAHLTIAGAYHEKDKDRRKDVLHLIGVTADDPPTYYYRRVEDAHYGAVAADRATHWGAWEKLNVQVPVRKASPVVHRGQLYLFWIRYVTKPQNRVKDGESKFTGYQHKAFVEFAKRKIDGTWTTPQKLRLNENPFTPNSFPPSYQDDGVILDPIVPKDSTMVDMPFFDFTFYSNYEPLYDYVTHEIPKEDYQPRGFQWDQLYPASKNDLTLRGVNFQMWSPVDLYRLEIGEQVVATGDPANGGVPWLNPALLVILWALSGGKFDLTAHLPGRLVWSRRTGDTRELHTTPSGIPCFDTYAYATVMLDRARIEHYEKPLAARNADNSSGPGPWTRPQWNKTITDYLKQMQKVDRIGDIPAEATIDVVNGSVGDVIIQTSRDAFYLQADVRADGKYHLRRLNTSLSEPIADTLFHDGLETLLATNTQLGLKEAATGLNLMASKVFDASQTGSVDYSGAMGAYMREVFFHIPFLIADHLCSQGRYDDAQKWYHYIFDPTSAEAITVPATLSAEEKHRRELDRNWRYREFRSLPFNSMRAQLTNAVAIEQYRRDPFNPHAIARLRLSAYQKAIVLKYADNLLDWGDDLFVKAFAQLNPEYLREATLKYVIAQEILGGRPAQLGDCGEGLPQPRTFATIKPHLDGDSEFLMELESVIVTGGSRTFANLDKLRHMPVSNALAHVATTETYAAGLRKVQAASAATAGTPPPPPPAHREATLRQAMTASAGVRKKAVNVTRADVVVKEAVAEPETKITVAHIGAHRLLNPAKIKVPNWGRSIIRQVTPIFCVPGNDRIQTYWNRVEDRLYKLRHCQDIDGNFRLLPLFAPEIDPALLVGGAAGGLSLEDILGASEGSVPPFRFRYILEKARGYAATVQGFGSALLAALEKRDGEELTRLRNLHQRNILTLMSEMKTNELKIAEQGVEIVQRRLTGAEYRRDYYEGLVSNGLLATEVAQQSAQLVSAGIRGAAMAVGIAAAITKLIPQVGSPFAMKYGGMEVGDSLANWLTVATNSATISDSVATTMGIIAGNERREDGWRHQLKLAEMDIKVIEKDLAVAELRRAIAARSVELHEKSRDQQDEIMALYDARFTNLALYTHLARTLQQMHREAYSAALSMARLTERAYRFERPDDPGFYVGGEWDSSRAGLLAGERLSLALAAMERRFVETTTRQAEINQTFSMSQIAPAALISLKQAGSCEFALPEFYFDLFYPGQYRRKIKAVRLTIPSITGPYTNIGAKLSLTRSYLRKEPVPGASQLVEVPVSGNPSIATSTAQGDAGVFELNFRDERYMPFEGAGAISEWRLELPANFRPFDYQSINDVLINISYTADDDAGLRQHVEDSNAALEGALLNYLSNSSLTRVISLRQEFSSAFNRLVEAPAGTSVTVDISERHFPLFLQGRTLKVAAASVVLDLVERKPVGSFKLKLNGTSLSQFGAPTNPSSPNDTFGGLPNKPAINAFPAGLQARHTLEIQAAGQLAASAGSSATLDSEQLHDILLVVDYSL